jgi:hypothetical protein
LGVCRASTAAASEGAQRAYWAKHAQKTGESMQQLDRLEQLETKLTAEADVNGGRAEAGPAAKGKVEDEEEEENEIQLEEEEAFDEEDDYYQARHRIRHGLPVCMSTALAFNQLQVALFSMAWPCAPCREITMTMMMVTTIHMTMVETKEPPFDTQAINWQSKIWYCCGARFFDLECFSSFSSSICAA